MSKILTLAATGLAGLVLGAGISAAAATGDEIPRPVDRPAMDTGSMGMGSMGTVSMDLESMDQMHAEMRDQMPAELAGSATRCTPRWASTWAPR